MSAIEPTDELASCLDDLSASDIPFNLGFVTERLWTVSAGHASNRTDKVCESLGEATEWLRAKAVELYPDSEFAKEWRRGFE